MVDLIIRNGQVIDGTGRPPIQADLLVKDGTIVTTTGKEIPVHAETICIHGDEPTGPRVAMAVRSMLEMEGIEIVTLPEMHAV